jgi:parallel beta-helix repeat protein
MSLREESHRRTAWSALVSASLAAALLFGGSEPALASHVGCGDTITTDTTLDSSLLNCPNNGLIIDGDGVTLDLRGYLVQGDLAPTPSCDPGPCDVGVAIEGHSRVEVTGGSIRAFGVGILAFRARYTRVVRVGARRNSEFGLLLASASRSVVKGSDFSQNLAPEGDGIGLFGTHRTRIARNTIFSNAGPGIHLGDARRNRIGDNRMADNAPSMLVEGSHNRIRGNRILRGAGIIVGPPGHRNRLIANDVIEAVDSIAIESGRGNRLRRNRVTRAQGAGIRLGLRRPPIGGSKTLVRNNLVRGTRGDGFLVHAEDSRSNLRGNLAIRSSDDGFDVRSRSAQLANNRALDNRDLGIHTVTAAVDAGGNVARGNGDARQCVGVACDP